MQVSRLLIAWDPREIEQKKARNCDVKLPCRQKKFDPEGTKTFRNDASLQSASANRHILQGTSKLQRGSLKSRLLRLLDLEKLNVERQLAVARNAGERLRAVCELGGDRQTTLATNAHADDTDVPSLDDLAFADLEGERLALLVGYNRC